MIDSMVLQVLLDLTDRPVLHSDGDGLGYRRMVRKGAGESSDQSGRGVDPSIKSNYEATR